MFSSEKTRTYYTEITVNMSGTYECLESNGLGSGKGSIQISVQPKKFYVSLSPQVVEVGERVVLSCVTGLENYVNWNFLRSVGARRIRISTAWRIIADFKTDYQLEANSLGDYNLVILRAKLNNTGTYECVEYMGFGPSSGTVELIVKIPVGTPQIVQVGKVAKLDCDIGSHFDLLLTHSSLTNGTSVIISDGSVMPQYRDTHRLLNTGDGKQSLEIQKAQHKHTGTYQCREDVSGGWRAMDSKLKVVDPESVNMKRLSVKVGEKTVLRLPYDDHFNQTHITWLFCKLDSDSEICSVVSAGDDSVPEKYTENSRVVVRNDSIEITNVTMNDQGMYYCVGVDQLAEPLVSIQLDVSEEGTSIVHPLVQVYCYY